MDVTVKKMIFTFSFLSYVICFQFVNIEAKRTEHNIHCFEVSPSVPFSTVMIRHQTTTSMGFWSTILGSTPRSSMLSTPTSSPPLAASNLHSVSMDCFFWTFPINVTRAVTRTAHDPLCLAALTQYVFEVHSQCRIQQCIISFYGWTVFHGLARPHLVYPFITRWASQKFVLRDFISLKFALCIISSFLIIHAESRSKIWKTKHPRAHFPNLCFLSKMTLYLAWDMAF